jgi:hypothetical protein
MHAREAIRISTVYKKNITVRISPSDHDILVKESIDWSDVGWTKDTELITRYRGKNKDGSTWNVTAIGRWH